MADSQHLLTVWNPHYAADALDQHLNVLLGWKANPESGADEVYVWWAKVRSPRRPTKLDHMREILGLAAQIEAGTETHLYITDYSSLYVGWLDEIRPADLYADESEHGHVPPYYLANRWPVDFWMRLRDIRCIVDGDTMQSCREMGKLLNVRYDRKPVSIYGGMVDIPLIVERKEPHLWFAARDELTGGRLFAEADAEIRGETSRMAKELRVNMFGKTIWDAMEPETRRFLAAGEAVFRARREDPNFDFSAVVVEYAKAAETELNELLFPAIRKRLADAPPVKRIVPQPNEREIDLGGVVRHQSIGSIRHLLEHEEIFKAAVRTAIRSDATWLLERLPAELNELRRYRNPAAHDISFAPATIDEERNRILGIACEGLIVKIVRAKMRLNSKPAIAGGSTP